MEEIQKKTLGAFETRLIVKEDRKDIVSWWKDWSFGIIPEFLLPKRGYIVLNGKDKVCATWLYIEKDLRMSWMSWTVCNKKLDIKVRREGLQTLVDFVKKESVALGKEIIFTTTENDSFRQRLEDSSFIKGDVSVDHYFYFGGQ